MAAEVAVDTVTESTDGAGCGAVTVAGLCWSQVVAVFADDTDAGPSIRAAAAAVAQRAGSLPQTEPGVRLEEWLVLPEVQQLLHDHGQLWHHPAENW